MNKFIFVALFALIVVAAAAPKGSKCRRACTDDYTPVCAGPTTGTDRPISFGNSCVVEKYNCENSKNYVVKSQGECPGGGGVRLS